MDYPQKVVLFGGPARSARGWGGGLGALLGFGRGVASLSGGGAGGGAGLGSHEGHEPTKHTNEKKRVRTWPVAKSDHEVASADLGAFGGWRRGFGRAIGADWNLGCCLDRFTSLSRVGVWIIFSSTIIALAIQLMSLLEPETADG